MTTRLERPGDPARDRQPPAPPEPPRNRRPEPLPAASRGPSASPTGAPATAGRCSSCGSSRRSGCSSAASRPAARIRRGGLERRPRRSTSPAEAYDVYNAANAGAQPSEKASVAVPARRQQPRPARSTTRPTATRSATSSTRLGALTATVDGETGPVFEQLVDPTRRRPRPASISPDRTTVRIAARVPGEGDVLVQRLAAGPGVRRRAARRDYPNLADPRPQQHARERRDPEAGQRRPRRLAAAHDPADVRDPAASRSGRSWRRSCRSILAVTALLAAFGILGLYSQFVSPVSPYASQLVVLIGLAVAVDYSLFMVTRFRTERRHGRAKLPRDPRRLEHRRPGRVLLRAGGR